MSNIKVYSWNVNGFRAVAKKNFYEFLEEHDPDILCLQETKAHPDQVNLDEIPDRYQLIWNSAVKKGYSGTSIWTKIQPISTTLGIGIEKHDQEGRVITAEFKDWYLVTVYTPNSQNELRRLDYRTTEWDVDFLNYVKTLPKPAIFCGDLNVAHCEIDLARPKANKMSPGFTEEERSRFDAILESGYLDSFRHFYPDLKDAYSWWSYRAGARGKNIGWRIDYVCVDERLKKRLVDAFICSDVLGSDHCPVGIEMTLPKSQWNPAT